MKPLKHIPSAEKEASPQSGGAGENKGSALQTPASFYEEVLMNIPADIAVYNTKGEFMFINSAVIKDVKTREWLIGKNIEDYFRKAKALKPTTAELVKQIKELEKHIPRLAG